MIENFLYLLYNDSMPKYVKTREYSFETFVADLNKNIIKKNDILSSGFKEENGVFKYVKNPLKTQSYIVLESKNSIENLIRTEALRHLQSPQTWCSPEFGTQELRPQMSPLAHLP